MKKRVLIIGGGASGLMAAIMAAREGAQVTILEHMDRVGKKILSTGNGRCNITNLSLEPEHYRSSQKWFPMKVLDRFSVRDTLDFFEEIGIVPKSRGGYIYPNSDQAASVLDALRFETEHLGIQTVLSCHIRKAFRGKNGLFTVESDQGTFRGDCLILAAGSKAAPVSGSDGSGYELAKAFGHTVIKPLPALVQLRCKGTFFKQLAGVRCEAEVRLVSGGKTLAADEGELQLTDYGISGIPTFQVSRFAARALDERRSVEAVLDLFPSRNTEDTRAMLKQRKQMLGYRPSGEFLNGVLNKKLAAVLLKLAGIPQDQPCSHIKDSQIEALTMQMKKFTVPVTATNSFEQAQVCCGGVDTRELSPETMESKLVRGLFLVGELTDVDGICGGYNLQWAWSTGAVAGRTAGRTENR